MDRLERFEMYCIFMFMLIALSLLLKSQITRNQNYVLCNHERRLRELEAYNETSPLEPQEKGENDV